MGNFFKGVDDFFQGIGRNVANIVNSITSLFGVDLRKHLKKQGNWKKWDYSNALRAINASFGKLDIENSRKLNNIQQRLDSLIQMPSSPVIKKFLGEVKSSLNKYYSDIQAKQASIDLKRTEATTLANDMDAASLGEMYSKEYESKGKRIDRLVQDAVDESEDTKQAAQEIKQIPGWEKVESKV